MIFLIPLTVLFILNQYLSFRLRLSIDRGNYSSQYINESFKTINSLEAKQNFLIWTGNKNLNKWYYCYNLPARFTSLTNKSAGYDITPFYYLNNNICKTPYTKWLKGRINNENLFFEYLKQMNVKALFVKDKLSLPASFTNKLKLVCEDKNTGESLYLIDN
jgi:hypothetical protein